MEWFLENPVTSPAYVGRALERPRLWPLIQEDHFGTVYSVGLPNEGITSSLYSAQNK